MAQEETTRYLDEAGGEEIAKQVKKLIETAIALSEKKIFGDGELAEAFDTIQEIGAYLKDHDDVAEALREAITKKIDRETYEEDKAEIEKNYLKKSEIGSIDEDTIRSWFD